MTRNALFPAYDADFDETVGTEECPTEIDREALYRQFQPLVAGLIRRYGKTPELRQDLTGEIYYRFCRLLEAYDPSRGIPLCAYVSRMLSQSVFNYVRDHWRQENRAVALDEESGQALETLPAPLVPLDELLVVQELRGRLPASIARLPHRQRLVLVWRYYDGRSFEEIARALDVKPATARSLLRHALIALRKRMEVAG